VRQGKHGTSRFPGEMRPRVLGVSDRAGFASVSRWRWTRCGLPLFSTASAPWRWRGFRGSIPGPRVPLSTLHRRPCGRAAH